VERASRVVLGEMRPRGEQLLAVMARRIPELLRHPVWRYADPGQGRGRGVLLIPGFGFGDRSLTLTRSWLRARGYRPEGAAIGLNIDCTTALLARIEGRLAGLADATGGKIIVLGQSRGGWLGRLAAIRRPDLVAGLVMFGSPMLDPLGAHPRTVRFARTLARLSGWGIPGLLDEGCLTGPCGRTHAAALIAALPQGLPAVSVFSRHDAVVPWWLCQDPYAEWLEVSSSHTAMGLDPQFYAVIEPRLATWAAGIGNGHNADPSGRLSPRRNSRTRTSGP
jgi:pimeloyl-ACP methyl ester carboxylesterase